MSVLLDTTLGELVVDLFVDKCPLATKNFLKLCKTKYYNNVLFFNVQENFMVQTGDPTGTGKGGVSLYGQLYGEQAKYFEDEIHYKFDRKGLVALANQGAPHTNGAQFFITTRSDDLAYLDGKHTIFGEIAEGMDVLDKINGLFVDQDGRPYQDVRIRHTYVLEDPFPDPELLQVPPASPMRTRPEDETVDERLAADEKLDDNQGRTEEEIEQSLREKEAKSRAVVLEMIGDLPDADVKPPDEVLFVCKLNPVTESSDLDMAFCRFGPCKAEVIRDWKTGDSLCFAFVEFQDRRHCEEAYFKMNNVLLDDRRIKVDFSQSVSKLWNKVKRRPWEKNSKSDGDPYANEKRGTRGRGPEVGKNLRLKQHGNRSGEDLDLVGSDDERERKDSHRSSRRERHGRDRAKEEGSSRKHRSRSRTPPRSSKESSSSRDKRRSRSRRRDRSSERGSDRDSSRGRDRSRDRESERDRKRDRGREHDRAIRNREDDRDRRRSGRDSSRDREGDRRSSKKSRRSRSASRERGSSRRP